MSGTIRFLGDTHFGHKTLATKYRKFSSAEEHDEYIVDKWNSVVRKKDTTYLVGDVTMEKRTGYSILDRLNGYKFVAGGNHDKPQHMPSLLEHVNGIFGAKKLKINGKNIMVTHIPVHPFEFDYRLDYNIHGHLHGEIIMIEKEILYNVPISVPDTRYLNTSGEHLDYTPRTFDELLEIKYKQL
jgi:calcineurin-like phosphoesterase family protein